MRQSKKEMEQKYYLNKRITSHSKYPNIYHSVTYTHQIH